MLTRKYADLRHAPALDPRLLRYDPARVPQAVLRLGRGCTPRTKGGLPVAAPGYTWALAFFPGRWYAVTAVYDPAARLVGYLVDIATPAEEHEGYLSVLDLKLDLVIPAVGEARWVDREQLEAEVRAGRVPEAWQRAIAHTVAWLDAERRHGAFPPPELRAFRPEPAEAGA